MRGSRVRAAVGAAAAVVAVTLPAALTACGSGDTAATGTTDRRPETDTGARTAARQATHLDFDRRNFTDSTRIDNRWSPLAPGTRYVYEGRSDRGKGRLPHLVVFTVTDLTKVIDGVRTVVLWDRDINGGRLLEAELAFHAQDDDGNVWNMGEYPEERDGGRVTGAPDTWIAGLAKARGGIIMRSDPRVGTSSYLQGFAPSIEFNDRARVLKEGVRDCVPLRCYTDVLVTDETNPSEPADGHQRKFYAPGVGNIRAAPAGGKEKEVLVLTQVVRLSPDELAAARREALKLDRRGYRVSKDVYARTPPAERAPGRGRSS
ncbi:MAG: hypothetical protein QOC64_871 [Solirubrobacteraceae bacterium]|nr:hypothetical protein [Solirubrobacteraceae bacterium]